MNNRRAQQPKAKGHPKGRAERRSVNFSHRPLSKAYESFLLLEAQRVQEGWEFSGRTR